MTRRDKDKRAVQGPNEAGSSDVPKLNRDIQAEIGKALRVMYDDVVKQGVPDRFANLLTNLDERQDSDKTPPSE